MALITWNAALELGFEEIDKQHRKLVNLTNDLHESMISGRSKTALVALLADLVTYTEQHFAYEERLFRQYGYPLIAEHTGQHSGFTKPVLDFKQKHSAGTLSLSIEIMEFLRQWLAEHISVTDRQFVDYLIAHRAPKAMTSR